MRTNLKFNHELRIYDVQANDFGDTEALGEPHCMKAIVEDAYGIASDGHVDSLTGDMLASILPTESFYVSSKGQLAGLVAQFSRFNGLDDKDTWYEITGQKPGQSFVSGQLDLVELTLVRIAQREVVDEG